MLSFLRVLTVGVSLLAALQASANTGITASQPEVYSVNGHSVGFAAIPDWVKPVELSTHSAPIQPDGAVNFRLVDSQVRVQDDQTTSYRRFVDRPLTLGGIEQSSKIQMSFNPAFEQLVVHRVGVWRNGVFESRFDAAALRILTTESEYSNDILTGELTALLYLKDVRLGDDVDYGYSLVRRDPIFSDHFSSWLALNWTVPVERRTVRILIPADRTVEVRHYNHDVAPAVSNSTAETIYTWDLENGPVMDDESDHPAQYDPQRALSVSDYTSWQDVADLEQTLFQIDSVASEEFSTLVARLKTLPKADAAMQALAFVQNEIRYVSLSLGSNAYTPRRPDEVLANRYGDCKDNRPDEVLANRYGDCKDKTLLLLHLLHAADIDAHAALVSTEHEQGIAELAPMPNPFDHVIVRAVIDDKPVWLDGTRRFQGTNLKTLGMYDYGSALVLAPEQLGGGLTTMAIPAHREPVQHVIERFIVDDYDEAARYEVDTVYEGSFAEHYRAVLAESGRSSLEQQYMDYQQSLYKGLTLAEPFSVEDDPELNRLTFRERYKIADLLTLNNGWWSYDISPYGIDIVLQVPEQTQRIGPAAIGKPGHYRSTVSIRMPHTYFPSDDIFFKADLGAIRYEFKESDDGQTVTASQSLRITDSSLSADAIPELIKLQESISDHQWIAYEYPENTSLVAFLRRVISVF